MKIMHSDRSHALLTTLTKATANWIVEIIDPAQSNRAVVERIHFPYYQKKKAEKYIKNQKLFDHWNKYELVRSKE